jgi:hypothetical protein
MTLVCIHNLGLVQPPSFINLLIPNADHSCSSCPETFPACTQAADGMVKQGAASQPSASVRNAERLWFWPCACWRALADTWRASSEGAGVGWPAAYWVSLWHMQQEDGYTATTW